MTGSDYLETKEELGHEPGRAVGCVMGNRDWREIALRLVPRLAGQKTGAIGRYLVAHDPGLEPDRTVFYYSRTRFDEHVTRIQ